MDISSYKRYIMQIIEFSVARKDMTKKICASPWRIFTWEYQFSTEWTVISGKIYWWRRPKSGNRDGVRENLCPDTIYYTFGGKFAEQITFNNVTLNLSSLKYTIHAFSYSLSSQIWCPREIFPTMPSRILRCPRTRPTKIVHHLKGKLQSEVLNIDFSVR